MFKGEIRKQKCTRNVYGLRIEPLGFQARPDPERVPQNGQDDFSMDSTPEPRPPTGRRTNKKRVESENQTLKHEVLKVKNRKMWFASANA